MKSEPGGARKRTPIGPQMRPIPMMPMNILNSLPPVLNGPMALHGVKAARFGHIAQAASNHFLRHTLTSGNDGEQHRGFWGL